MQVIRRDDSSRQRPFVLFTPVPADKDAAFRSLVRITSTHDKDSDRRFTIDSVIRALEPVVKPAQLKLIEVDCGLGTELGFAGIAAGSSAVGPGAHDQALQALLVLAERDVVQVCNLRTPGVIPAVEVIRRGCPCTSATCSTTSAPAIAARRRRNRRETWRR